jgi:hypothetical protein
MNQSAPSSRTKPETGRVCNEDRIAARQMIPPPTTAAAPFEVIRRTRIICSCWPGLRSTLNACTIKKDRCHGQVNACDVQNETPRSELRGIYKEEYYYRLSNLRFLKLFPL